MRMSSLIVCAERAAQNDSRDGSWGSMSMLDTTCTLLKAQNAQANVQTLVLLMLRLTT